MTILDQIIQHWFDVLAGLFVVFLMYRRGMNQTDDRLILMQKETIDQQDRKLKDQQDRADAILRDSTAKADAHTTELMEKISELSLKSDQQAKDLAHLQGVVQEKEKKLQSLDEILKGRDPASQELAKMAYEYMKTTGAVLAEIHQYIISQKTKGIT